MQRQVREAFEREAELEDAYQTGFFSVNDAICKLGDQFVRALPYALIEGPDVFVRALKGAARAYKHTFDYVKLEQLAQWTRVGLASFNQDSDEAVQIQAIENEIRKTNFADFSFF